MKYKKKNRVQGLLVSLIKRRLKEKQPETKSAYHSCGIKNKKLRLGKLGSTCSLFICQPWILNVQTHLFVPLVLSALLQGESSQLIGSLLHQVDVADGIGQGFNDV